MNNHPTPSHRRLQVFSLDPSIDVKLESALISRAVVNIRWEDNLKEGPSGEYIEVIDIDPSSECAYDPIDLNAHELLATDGLAPSTGNPQFHQQMVYAIAMLTIANFERAIGRDVIWAERRHDEKGEYISKWSDRYVQCLRIYPHALRQQNAYYSPAKKALLFGYFNSPSTDPRDELPGGLVFTSLSHDIIAHETTHAILDGIHRRLLEASNEDMLAFHEAFADIVAIFQHFTLPGLLLDQIQKTRGRLDRDNLLAQLATQFGYATGRGGALRNALTPDSDGKRKEPDPSALGRTFEPHDRGAILVAAVFDAFLLIYNRRIADLIRIATEGTGILPDGEIHPDLANRFASEAVKSAERVLTICIRAIDYLPPVDITFGDYARALITADADLYPDDPKRYRVAFIEAFRDRGIYPLDVRTLSEETLRWKKLTTDEADDLRPLLPSPAVLRTMAYAYEASNGAANHLFAKHPEIFDYLGDGKPGKAEEAFLGGMWNVAPSDGKQPPAVDRRQRYYLSRTFAAFLHEYISERAKTADKKVQKAGEDFLGLDIEAIRQSRSAKNQRAQRTKGHLEVHAVRPTLRVRPDGRSKTELLVMLTQRRKEALGSEEKPESEASHNSEADDSLSFYYRGGCTLVIDPEQGCITYAISKNLTSERRLKRHRTFLQLQLRDQEDLAVRRLGLTDQARKAPAADRLEPLAVVHGEHGAEGGY